MAEQERFDNVLNNASDDELFVVLRYAIANEFLPNCDVDQYHDMYVMVGVWKRSLKVYEKLSRRPDLLQQIYYGRDYPDTIVAQTIIRNARGEGHSLDSLMGFGSSDDENTLHYKYYSTPMLYDK